MRISQRRERAAQSVKPGCPAGTVRSDEGIASSGVTFQLWRLYQHAWLVCLFFPLVSLMSKPHTSWRLAGGVFALLFFAASYTWLMWPHPASQGAHARTRSHIAFLLFVALAWAVREGTNPLTPRERDVLSAALLGASLAEIAARLILSEGPVRNHLSTAIQKLGTHNRMEAARLAEQKGWL